MSCGELSCGELSCGELSCGEPSSGGPAGYRLTPAAVADLDDIWRHIAETWSVEPADRYSDDLVQVLETIATMPSIAGERRDFIPPVRIHSHQSHLIVYRMAESHIEVLRLLGGRQDWLSVLKAADA